MRGLRTALLLSLAALSGCSEEKPSNAPPPPSAACEAFQLEANQMQDVDNTMSDKDWNAWVDDFKKRMADTLTAGEVCIISGDGKRY